MAGHKLPLPPQRGTDPTTSDAGPAETPAPSHVPPHMAAMTRHDARLVNLDTGAHVDSHGVEHKTHAGNPARVGPLTVIFAHTAGHPPMRFGDHARAKTNVHQHIRGKARPHPNALAIQIAGRMKLPRAPKSAPEGSPVEEAGETLAQEAAEQRAGTEGPPRRIPLPPRKVA